MKNLRRLSLLLTLLLPATAFSADLKRMPASSRISAVTVYPDRALTSRSASLDLKPGGYLVVFEDLPPLIQDDSVRVEGKGSAGVTIVGLEVKRAFLEQSGVKRVQELDEEIRALEQRAGALDAKKSGLSSQKAFFDSIRVAWGERISKELAIGRPTATELQEAAGFVGSGVTKAEQQSVDLDFELKSIKNKIDALRRQREQSSGSARKETKTVEVTLDVAREGKLTLDLSAVSFLAGWLPAYDVRLAADSKSAELTFRAMVRQQTGEEWNNVALTLSTARPAAGGAPPELPPWRISFPRPQPMAEPMYLMGSAAPRPRMKAGAPSRQPDSEAVDGAMAPALVETARVDEQQSSVAFHIPRALDIPSDGSQHGCVIDVQQLPVGIEYTAVPKLSPLVYLKSEIVNKAPYALLPGKVNTFVGNTFTGSSPLKKIAAGEKFDLFFGSDDQVTVKREELKQHKEAGFFGRNRVTYRYRIELSNFHKEPIVVILRDQLPLPGDQEIKVSLDDPSLKPDESEADGKLTWRVALKAGEKKEITFGILIEYPKDRELSGL